MTNLCHISIPRDDRNAVVRDLTAQGWRLAAAMAPDANGTVTLVFRKARSA